MCSIGLAAVVQINLDTLLKLKDHNDHDTSCKCNSLLVNSNLAREHKSPEKVDS